MYKFIINIIKLSTFFSISYLIYYFIKYYFLIDCNYKDLSIKSSIIQYTKNKKKEENKKILNLFKSIIEKFK